MEKKKPVEKVQKKKVNARGLVAIEFIRDAQVGFARYNAGLIAGFPEKQADELIDKKIAKKA